MLLYPQQHPNNEIWVTHQLQNCSNQLTQYGIEHMNYLRRENAEINNEASIRNAKYLLRDIQTCVVPNIVLPLFTPSGLQNAPPIMQRFVMADPFLRKEYQRGTIEWYPETYVDEEPDKIGIDHYDYRVVMSNVVQDDGSYFISLEELKPGDSELTDREKSDIVQTWEYIRKAVDNGYDPFKKYRI